MIIIIEHLIELVNFWAYIIGIFCLVFINEHPFKIMFMDLI